MSQQTAGVSIGQRLYLQLQALAESFEGELQSTHERFLHDAIPICKKIQEVKPWLTPEFASLQNPDEKKALLGFLRASFCYGSERKVAYNQASVLAMIVMDGLSFADVKGIQFGRLTKLSYSLDWISAKDRLELLNRARTAANFQEFEAYVESVKAGHHIEPQKIKFYAGPESAVQSLNNYHHVTKQRGDKRPEIEKLADLANSAILVEPETNTKAVRIINAFCRFIRSRSQALALDSDQEIVAAVIWEAWASYKDEFDEDTAKEYAEIQAMK